MIINIRLEPKAFHYFNKYVHVGLGIESEIENEQIKQELHNFIANKGLRKTEYLDRIAELLILEL